MKKNTDNTPLPGQRIADSLIGALFLGCGIAILFLDGPKGLVFWIAFVFLAGLGSEALWSAYKKKPSLLGKIGPLP